MPEENEREAQANPAKVDAELDSGKVTDRERPGTSGLQGSRADELGSGSESEAELLRTVEVLRKQIQRERKAKMQAERDRLAQELSEMRSVTPKPRNAPQHGEAQVKARSPRRRFNVNAKVKAVRGGGGRVGGKVARKSPLRSPPRRKSKDRRNLNDLRALHDLSEVADSELANWGLAEGSSDESEPEEDQGMLGEFRGTQADFKPNSQRDNIAMLADEIESMGRQASRQKISSELGGPVGTGKYRLLFKEKWDSTIWIIPYWSKGSWE